MTALAILLLAAAVSLYGLAVAFIAYLLGYSRGSASEHTRVEAWGRTQHERTR